MMAPEHQPVPSPSTIAILNTSPEVIELLEIMFRGEGFTTVGALTLDFKRGLLDFRTFVATHQPHAVLYDIALPYEENWYYFQDAILGAGVLPKTAFVLTTTNKSVLEVLVGPTPTFELVGRPFDLSAIVAAVRHALEQRGAE